MISFKRRRSHPKIQNAVFPSAGRLARRAAYCSNAECDGFVAVLVWRLDLVLRVLLWPPVVCALCGLSEAGAPKDVARRGARQKAQAWMSAVFAQRAARRGATVRPLCLQHPWARQLRSAHDVRTPQAATPRRARRLGTSNRSHQKVFAVGFRTVRAPLYESSGTSSYRGARSASC